MRYFNTFGPNIPEKHYTLPRTGLIERGKKKVYDERYFTIWAPRQTGKSTYFRFLAIELRKEGYKVAHVNFENFRHQSHKDFLIRLHSALTEQWELSFDGTSLASLFQEIEDNKTDKAVLIIDEVEGINAEYFGDFLHSIRNAYHSRTNHALKSVILVGVSNIIGVVQDNASPFNISDNLNVPYFTDEETRQLLEQHEQETGQLFEEKVKTKISDITANQPGLVNAFAYRLVEENPDKSVIDYEDYLLVEDWYLTEAIDKHVENIVNKAKKHRTFIERLLFTDEKVRFQIHSERIKELSVNGIIRKDKEGFVCFNVPLYQKCLHAAFYPDMNGEGRSIQKNIHAEDYFDASGRLNLDKVLREYQSYAQRRGFQAFREQDEKGNYLSIREAGLVYSFETFINAFLELVRGKSYLEAHIGLGRTDLLINVNGDEQVVEAKVYQNITQFGDGKVQLAYYVNRMGLKMGYYLVFVDTEVTHTGVAEADEMIDGIQIKTYLVRFDMEKDFTAPRKERAVKRRL